MPWDYRIIFFSIFICSTAFCFFLSYFAIVLNALKALEINRFKRKFTNTINILVLKTQIFRDSLLFNCKNRQTCEKYASSHESTELNNKRIRSF